MLASEAVTRAYREAAIKPVNSPALTAAELDEGLSRLNGFIASLFGMEIGENLTDWAIPTVKRNSVVGGNAVALPFSANQSDFDQTLPLGNEKRANSYYAYNPPQNSRLLWREDSPATVYFPTNPNDGARMAIVDVGSSATVTLDGNGRLIAGGTTQVLLPGFSPLTWFYRADLASWQIIAPLALTDPLPLPAEFDDLLVSGTAIRLTGLDEIKPTSGTLFIYERLIARCKQRYRQSAPTSYGGQNLVPTEQNFNQWGAGMGQW